MVDKPQIVTAPAAEANLNDVKSDLDQLKADFTKLLETLGKTAKHSVKGAKGEAETAAGEVGDWAEEQFLTLRESIREQPITACAIAAGVGVILGQILLRR
ncbi:hypothetical protein [Xanthobacter flavus]|uniref:hypothetical protein n=1 Tax=Xanthobacter flavus TaxID=281 RepID=UPI0037269B91